MSPIPDPVVLVPTPSPVRRPSAPRARAAASPSVGGAS